MGRKFAVAPKTVEWENSHKDIIFNCHPVSPYARWATVRSLFKQNGNGRYCMSIVFWCCLIMACKNKVLNFPEFCELFYTILITCNQPQWNYLH